MQDLKSEITKTWNNCNKNVLYFLIYKMCFIHTNKQTHTFYIYSIGSPSKRGFPYTVQFVHQTGGVGIRPIPNFTTLIVQYYNLYRSKTKRYLYQNSLVDFYKIHSYHWGPAPAPSTVSMVRLPSSSSRCPQCVPSLTLHWLRLQSPSPDGAHEPSSA